jgi:GNAT superfamily N-acetyltransferase
MNNRLSRYLEYCRNNNLPVMILAAATRWFIHGYSFVDLDLEEEMPEPRPVPGLTWSLAERGDVARIHGLDPLLSIQDMRIWLSKGYRCIMLSRDDQLVFYWWLSLRPLYHKHLGLYLTFDSQSAIGAGVYTHPAWRRRGLLWQATVFTRQYLKSEGFRRLIGKRMWWNNPPRRFAEKVGYRRLGNIWRYRLGPLGYYRASGSITIHDNKVAELGYPIRPSTSDHLCQR